MLIYNLKLKDLEDDILNNGFKKYRAMQVFEWLYQKKISNFSDMSNIGSDLMVYLNEKYQMDCLTLVKQTESSDQTVKLLYKLNDGNLIETVLMKHHYGLSLCITSQVGCNMGCLFCASGRLKKMRDLETAEMLAQVIKTEKILDVKINSVVVMGIGEPFDNYDNLVAFLETINHPKGMAIGARHLTVSTCGIIPKIYEFAKLNTQVNLAISLHSANNEKRAELMPINKRYPLNDLMNAIRDYIKSTGRRVTIEYILIKDINDSLDDAKALSRLLKGMNVYVNLIPYNEVEELDIKRSAIESRNKFYQLLVNENIDVTLRRETGGDIDAACGQLRSKNGGL